METPLPSREGAGAGVSARRRPPGNPEESLTLQSPTGGLPQRIP
jgi:hypothetical protein